MLRSRALVALFACLSMQGGCGLFGRKAAEEPERGVAPILDRAAAAAEAGEWDAAIEGYSQALERTPWNTRFVRLLAVAHAERAAETRRERSGAEGLDAAEKDLRRAVELDPADPVFRRNLGIVLLEHASYERDPARAAALRAEGAALAPDAAEALPDLQRDVERSLDLAVDLIERSQLEAAIVQLEQLRGEYPERADVVSLLAQANVRAGNEEVTRRESRRAVAFFQRAVALYAEIDPCDGGRCTADEQRVAHQNLIVALYESGDPVSARKALDAAEAAGMSFPGLAKALR
jgi:tetratricopeptide (TPR) repeat protein